MTDTTLKRENSKFRDGTKDAANLCVVNRQEEAEMASILSVVQDELLAERSSDQEVPNKMKDPQLPLIETNIQVSSNVIETALTSKNGKTRYKRAPSVHDRPKSLITKIGLQLDEKKEKDVLQSTRAVSNLELIIERSNHLCSRWDRLLGGRSRAAVLNEYLKKVSGFEDGDNNWHDYTNLHLAQMFDTLHPKTQKLPQKSPVMACLKKADHSEGYELNGSIKNGERDPKKRKDGPKGLLPVYELAKSFSVMTSQNTTIKRRKIHHLSCEEVMKRLKSYENEVSHLDRIEERIRCKGSELGLIPSTSNL